MTTHRVVAQLAALLSRIFRSKRAVVPLFFAASESLFVVVSEMRGHSATTRFTARDRSAVSIAQSFSLSLGGSIKRDALMSASGLL